MGRRPGHRHRGTAVTGGVVRELRPADRPQLETRMLATWGSTRMVSRGRLFNVPELKPEIGLVGDSGIPIRDELELELPAAEWPRFTERHSWPSS